jgi:V-type H+-transporting ATPase subunit d
MIDNVILLITGSLHDSNMTELLEKCHPLGTFDAMATLGTVKSVADLYNTVLVDTPLGPYMQEVISDEDFDEVNIEIVRNTLYKHYLQDFYHYCQQLGGATAEIMCELLTVSDFAKFDLI